MISRDDINKLHRGDHVAVAFTAPIDTIHLDGVDVLIGSEPDSDAATIFVPWEEVVGQVEIPIVAGDEVILAAYSAFTSDDPTIFQVISVDDGKAWIRSQRDYDTVMAVNLLKRVTE